MNSIPKSIGLQNFVTMLRSSTKQERFVAIERRLDQTVSLYETEKVLLRKDIWHTDIFHLNKMLKTAIMDLSYEILGVSKLYSKRGMGAQFSQRCRNIHMEAKDKETAEKQVKPLLGAWHVLCAFPDEDLTITVE
jgi:hypothetical protein